MDDQMTFGMFCIAHKVEKHERQLLAWHLAMLRAQKLYEKLRADPVSKRRRTLRNG